MHSQGIIVQIMGALKILAWLLLLLQQCHTAGFAHAGVGPDRRFSFHRLTVASTADVS